MYGLKGLGTTQGLRVEGFQAQGRGWRLGIEGSGPVAFRAGRCSGCIGTPKST